MRKAHAAWANASRMWRSQCGRHMPRSGERQVLQRGEPPERTGSPPAAVARLGVSRHMLQVGTADVGNPSAALVSPLAIYERNTIPFFGVKR
ncbi:MAG: hypothetical protein KME49_05630 [Brasilonema octagenarum HA4186-MV1]|nr:hypothetical protein [Brasilonema octagenarum HA4186-MV1]